jgi:hypothetical protein
MPYRHGKNTKVLVGGYDLSAYFNEASVSEMVETGETTTFGTSAKTYITGLTDGTVSISGMFDGATGAVDAVLSSVLGSDTAVVFSVAPEGLAITRRLYAGESRATSYEISSPVADVVSVSGELQVTGGVGNSVSLCDLASVSASGNGTAVDNTASTSNGGVAVLHVTANAHNNTSVFKVQHSADNSTWADLATFTTVATTVVTAEKVAVTGTVNRYLRAQRTLAGTGALTFHVNFSRS